jgi:hypothetical protein
VEVNPASPHENTKSSEFYVIIILMESSHKDKSEWISVRFLRKLVLKDRFYGTISVPKPVLDAWASVENVEIQFDENAKVMVITPKKGE